MKRVFLVGYMGAGKTTVGKELAKLAGLSFIDLDYYIEGRYHKAVSQIFAERGEEAFREIERNMLHEVAEFEDVLISTGGGAPCFPVLKGRSGEELRAFIAESLEKRNPFYTKASITFDAEKMLTESDVHDISNALMKIL